VSSAGDQQGLAAGDTGCLNLNWCAALLDGLAAVGLGTLVLSPGSRSTPMVLAAQRRDGLAILPILDERSAAFFALGAARASGRPVALLATSGSAPSHWYPAVIEASESGVPLILISADRPPRLRNWGANQTIDQTRLFGAFVRESHDPGLPQDDPASLKAIRALGLRAGSISLGPRPGPVHLNLPFDEPLVPAGDCQAPAEPRSTPAGWPSAGEPNQPAIVERTPELPAGRGIIVCGPGSFTGPFAAALHQCAEHLGLPVLADPLSGLRFGSGSGDLVSGYDALLCNAEAADTLRPDWVLRFGRAPVSKRLGQWLSGIPTLLVDAGCGWSDPTHDVTRLLRGEPAALCRSLARDAPRAADRAWRNRWLAAERRIGALAERHLMESDWCEGQMLRLLMLGLPAGEALLCANSMPIRQLDTWSGTRAAPLILYGNRGVSGIDGQVSTLAGLNHGGPPCWALLGDLSLAHDLSGLLQGPRLRRPLLVINNGGGRIFDYLPQHGLPDFETLWRTPVDLDLPALAATFRLQHRLVADATDLRQLLDDASRQPPGQRMAPALVEIPIDADRSREIHLGYWRRVERNRLVDRG
jgi:2-succinyl-5-enolpyruvyl-6-hydroxy-3-cyclohexene-1-carboxylate synthase